MRRRILETRWDAKTGMLTITYRVKGGCAAGGLLGCVSRRLSGRPEDMERDREVLSFPDTAEGKKEADYGFSQMAVWLEKTPVIPVAAPANLPERRGRFHFPIPAELILRPPRDN